MKTEDELVDKVVERIILLMPEIIGNLMAEKAAKAKAAEEFYKQHKEFTDHRQIAAATIERIESENPGLEIKDVLDLSVPEIEKSIKNFNGLDLEKVNKPSLNMNGEF